MIEYKKLHACVALYPLVVVLPLRHNRTAHKLRLRPCTPLTIGVRYSTLK